MEFVASSSWFKLANLLLAFGIAIYLSFDREQYEWAPIGHALLSAVALFVVSVVLSVGFGTGTVNSLLLLDHSGMEQIPMSTSYGLLLHVAIVSTALGVRAFLARNKQSKVDEQLEKSD
jgi:O-antigen ligase